MRRVGINKREEMEAHRRKERSELVTERSRPSGRCGNAGGEVGEVQVLGKAVEPGKIVFGTTESNLGKN